MLPLMASKDEIEKELHYNLKKLDGIRSVGAEEHKDLMRLYYRQMMIKNHYEGLILTQEHLKPLKFLITKENIQNVLQEKYLYGDMAKILMNNSPMTLLAYTKVYRSNNRWWKRLFRRIKNENKK